MQFFTGISENYHSKSYMLLLTECVLEFRNDAFWDTHQYALLQQSVYNIVFWKKTELKVT